MSCAPTVTPATNGSPPWTKTKAGSGTLKRAPQPQPRGKVLCSVTFFVFLSAAAWAWFVAPDFVGVDDLLLGRRGAVAADELQFVQLLIFVPLEFFGHFLDGGSRGALLPFGDGSVLLFFFVFFLVFVHWEGQHRGGPLQTRLSARNLQEEQIAQRLVFDAVHHVLEQDEGFLLILHQRV